ncbi:MFS transporter [Sphingobium nicotianae]|uniref:MFS transporter n=1 Tax=Sphingobium nicotianae TaxID=2782607 RepID=A0A9X1DBK9_9SPHN|nr:MFS transporter [Sphingobium nicotianae]MBT2187045.1 MFS transporter [Sphingobium nicotianae]
MVANDPRQIINDNPMSARQWIVVVLMIFLNALDGFDVLSSAFAAPGITKEWGIPRSQLGIVLSAELIGMGFGSILLGSLADKIGRKLDMIICLVVMAIGMYMAHAATGVTELTLWRLITGLGIGGMLAATNAVTAEVSSTASRSLAMSLYVIGYPLGGVIGGFAAQGWLLVEYDWRAVFLFGAVVTAVMIPLVMLLVPETPAFFAARRPEGAVAKINKSLRAFGKPQISDLPPVPEQAAKPRVTDILSNPRLRPTTLLLAFGYMFHTLTFYYILKFAVQIVADTGFSQPLAASVLTYANIGGAVGGALFGFLLKKWDIKVPTIVMCILGVLAVAWFGLGHDTLGHWRLAGFFTMFFLNAAIVGYYAAFARGFPAYARATGTGFVLGVGRAGAAGSPIIAGFLFDALGKDQLLAVSLIMCAGALIGAVLVWLVPLHDADEVVAGRA